MSEEYNPETKLLEQAERIEVELKELVGKRDAAGSEDQKRVLQDQIDEKEAELKRLRDQLKEKLG